MLIGEVFLRVAKHMADGQVGAAGGMGVASVCRATDSLCIEVSFPASGGIMHISAVSLFNTVLAFYGLVETVRTSASVLGCLSCLPA